MLAAARSVPIPPRTVPAPSRVVPDTPRTGPESSRVKSPRDGSPSPPFASRLGKITAHNWRVARAGLRHLCLAPQGAVPAFGRALRFLLVLYRALMSIGAAASVVRESERLILERLRLDAWCFCRGNYPGGVAGRQALTSNTDLRPLHGNLLRFAVRMGITTLVRCTVVARSVGKLVRRALILSSTLYRRVLCALWSAGLYCRRVIRFDAFLGRIARLCSRPLWSRSPCTYTRPPAVPEGVTCAVAGGPADTILDIPGNASARGDAPLPPFARLTATLYGGLVRMCRPLWWRVTPTHPVHPSEPPVEVMCNTDTIIDVDGPGMDAAPYHGRPSYYGRLPTSFLGSLGRLWLRLTLTLPVPPAELVEVHSVEDVVIDIQGLDTDTPWSAGLHWRRAIQLDALSRELVRLRYRLPWPRSASTLTRPTAELEEVVCVADAAIDILGPDTYAALGDDPLPSPNIPPATCIGGLARVCSRPPWPHLTCTRPVPLTSLGGTHRRVGGGGGTATSSNATEEPITATTLGYPPSLYVERQQEKHYWVHAFNMAVGRQILTVSQAYDAARSLGHRYAGTFATNGNYSGNTFGAVAASRGFRVSRIPVACPLTFAPPIGSWPPTAEQLGLPP